MFSCDCTVFKKKSPTPGIPTPDTTPSSSSRKEEIKDILEKFNKIMKDGSLKVKIDQGSTFQRIWVAHDFLCWDEKHTQCFGQSQKRVKISDVKKIIQSNNTLNFGFFFLSLVIKNSSGQNYLILEFKNNEDLQMFQVGFEEMIRIIKTKTPRKPNKRHSW